MTAAELPLEQKNILSHRARALRGLLRALRSEFGQDQGPDQDLGGRVVR